MKIQIMGGKVCLRCKGKTLLSIVNKLFSLYTPRKLSGQWFEFSLKVKVIGSNPGYLLKSSLLYQRTNQQRKWDNLTYFLYLISEPVEPKSWIGWNHIENFGCTHKWTHIKVPILQICSNKIRQFCLGIMSWPPREIQKCWQTGRVANFWVYCLHTRVYIY